MIFNIHAGHNPDGRTAHGAVGLIKESSEARKVTNEVVFLLEKESHTVYNCTVNDGTSQSNVLSKIVQKCNAHKVDLDISIHFNSGRNDYRGDSSTGGTEVWVYGNTSKANDAAHRVCKKVSSLGLRNRGVKTSKSLYFLKKSLSPAMLIECCFVDDADDVKQYDYKSMAKAIVEGILNKTISATAPFTSTTSVIPTMKKEEFKVKVTDNALNIRAGAGTNHKIIGCIKDRGTYTITETSNSWGKLKSGAGWINISTKYVKYI